jgi:hypothetical protein
MSSLRSEFGSLDHLVGLRQQQLRHGEVERLGGLQIDGQG